MGSTSQDPTFVQRFIVPLLTIISGSSLIGLVVMLGVMPKHKQLGSILVCAMIAVMVAVLAVLHNRVLGHYRCPQCRVELPRHRDAARRDEYLFYCQNCDVLWRTGLREGE